MRAGIVMGSLNYPYTIQGDGQGQAGHMAVFSVFFSNLCNRLLTLGIVIYRFTLVLGSSLVLSSNQKKVLENFILLAILLTSLNLTGWAVYYREDYRYFLGDTKICKKIAVDY